jgi:two-component system, OmpR family, response regulator MprA
MRILKNPADAAPSIYVVDDAPFLTELYTHLLEASGYIVRAFNDRAQAVKALEADWNKPDLLISDYRGLSMSVDQFLHQCLMIHPALRILMVSGLSRTEVRFSQARPDQFIEKPFTAEQLQEEVKSVLAVGFPRSKTSIRIS